MYWMLRMMTTSLLSTCLHMTSTTFDRAHQESCKSVMTSLEMSPILELCSIGQPSECVDCQLRQDVEDVELHEHSQAHALHAYFARLQKETQK
jgi:hypothetical protein